MSKWKVRNTLFALLAVLLCVTGCKGEASGSSSEPHDPSKPVKITDFLPKSGGVGQRLVIYGDNFGNDKSLIRVTIGGREAIVIGVNNEGIYCVVPEKAYDGDIKIYVGSGENPKVANSAEVFDYQRKMVVSTIAGYKNERNDQGWVSGSFKEAAGFAQPCLMSFDPLDRDRLYISYDNGPGLYLVNFSDSTITQHLSTSTVGSGGNRFRGIQFTPDGEYMVVGHSNPGENVVSNSIMSRRNDFKDPQILTQSRGNQGVAIHPVNGELYFCEYQTGTLRRYDLMNSKPVGGTLDPKGYEDLYKIQDVNWEFWLSIHPSGDYAYIIVTNQHYILRTDYNWLTKRFMMPYLVCGEPRTSGYVDGVGASARLNTPYQGVYVKNPEYEGDEDEYDFYFTERGTHAIRLLRPDGRVETFAGRGSTGLNANRFGYVDGDLRLEARFDAPSGLAYNEEEGAFYIVDVINCRLRKIALEKID
jgi:DNA-binding beta-propeller fold protein YncE